MGSSQTMTAQISARVRTAIDEYGQSWNQVAEKTGIPRETLRRRLRGVSAFTIDELETIALSLGLDSAAFLDSTLWTEAS